MRIYTTDYANCVNIVSQKVWLSLFSTAAVRLSEDDKDFLQFAMDFFSSGKCVADDAQITARQIEIVRKRFQKIATTDIVHDIKKPSEKVFDVDYINKSATSCADLFITTEGKDLFEELIKILKCADKSNVDTLVDYEK